MTTAPLEIVRLVLTAWEDLQEHRSAIKELPLRGDQWIVSPNVERKTITLTHFPNYFKNAEKQVAKRRAEDDRAQALRNIQSCERTLERETNPEVIGQWKARKEELEAKVADCETIIALAEGLSDVKEVYVFPLEDMA